MYVYFFLFLISSYFLFGIDGGGLYEFVGAADRSNSGRRRTGQIRNGGGPDKFGKAADRTNSDESV